MQNHFVGRYLHVTIAGVFLLAVTALSFSAGQSPERTPRLPDETVNLGRVPGEKGIWALPYITNMGARDIVVGAPPAATTTTAGTGQRAGLAAIGSQQPIGTGQRGGASSEPWVPFMPWSAAVYNYNSLSESKYDPEGYCLPPGGPRLFATPYPMEIIQQPEHKRIIMVFEGGAHVWREIYMDGRPHPSPEEIKGQTWLGHSVGRWEGDTLVVDIVGFMREPGWITTGILIPASFISSKSSRGQTRIRSTMKRRSMIGALIQGRGA